VTDGVLLSAVIATYNRRDSLSRLLQTIQLQDLEPDHFEVVVVVDGSTDGTTGMLRAMATDFVLRVLEQPNSGQASAQNRGIRAATGSVVLFLDDDMLCTPSLFREHVAAHSADAARAVCGLLLVADDSTPGLATEWMRACTDTYVSRIRAQAAPKWPDDAIIFPNMSVSRKALLDAGGFAEEMAGVGPSIIADVDLGLRLWEMGVPFEFRLGAVAFQRYVKSDADLVGRDACWYGRAEVDLLRRHPRYRPHSWLVRACSAAGLKRLKYSAVMKSPLPPDLLLRVPYAVLRAAQSLPAARAAGVRMLHQRQFAVMLRSAAAVPGSAAALRREFGCRLPVLLYHHVGPPVAGSYPSLTVTPRRFEEQVRWLSRTGHESITPAAWLAYCRAGAPVPPKPVMITFDDAYADLAEHAFPVLRRYGFGATVFVPTACIAGTNRWDLAGAPGVHRILDEAQVRGWAAQGMEFGAHSRTHADLTLVTPEELDEEVGGSKADLGAVVGSDVDVFAYPYGKTSPDVRAQVAKQFSLAFGVEEGLNDLLTPLTDLRRTMVLDSDSSLEFALRVRLGFNPLLRARARVRLRTRLARLREAVGQGNAR
jgi:peptidoglycan/xylan/chitin deacetylase (PgdA/CDA1 family)/glycosyltransferase involved in cell wall biosynthesis